MQGAQQDFFEECSFYNIFPELWGEDRPCSLHIFFLAIVFAPVFGEVNAAVQRSTTTERRLMFRYERRRLPSGLPSRPRGTGNHRVLALARAASPQAEHVYATSRVPVRSVTPLQHGYMPECGHFDPLNPNELRCRDCRRTA